MAVKERYYCSTPALHLAYSGNIRHNLSFLPSDMYSTVLFVEAKWKSIRIRYLRDCIWGVIVLLRWLEPNNAVDCLYVTCPLYSPCGENNVNPSILQSFNPSTRQPQSFIVYVLEYAVVLLSI